VRIQKPTLSFADVECLQQFNLGERLKPADHTLDDRDIPRLKRLLDRTEQLRQTVTRDDITIHMSKTPHGLMAMEIGPHFGAQRRYESSVAQEQVGLWNFTQRRTALLRTVPGAQAIASQYGQSFATDRGKQKAFYPLLSIANEPSVAYHRGWPWEGLQEHLESLYTQMHGPLPEDHDIEFVNSSWAVDYLKSLFKTISKSNRPLPPPQPLAHGVFAVPFHTDDAEQMEDFLTLIGARPSGYQARRALCGELPSVKPSANVDNYRVMLPLVLSQPNAPSHRLRLASQEIGTGALAHTAADLTDSAVAILVNRAILDRHRQDPLLHLGLVGVYEQMENLCTLHNDTPRFGNAYRALIEELHVILAQTKPYSLQDFKDGALRQLHNRIEPKLLGKLKIPEVHLATSGMNAILQGLEVAKMTTGDSSVTPLSTNRHGRTPLYYEVEDLLACTGRKISPQSKTLLATLNNSVPAPPGRDQDPWDVDAVIEATRAQVAKHKTGDVPFTLVLDTTLERREDLKALTNELQNELVTGKLQIAVCKSYQKFANLCSSKVMAGGVFLLGAESAARVANDTYLKTMEEDLNWMENDESQLMTHFVQSGHQEFNLLERAVENAKFVRDNFLSGQGEHAEIDGYHEHLPFAMISGHHAHDGFDYPSLMIRDAEGELDSYEYGPLQNLDMDRVRYRASFAFSETTLSGIPNLPGYDPLVIRLAFGQESKAELTEMFYMTSRMLLDASLTGPLDALSHINELIKAALTPEQQQATANKSLAHKLVMVGGNEAASLDDRLRAQGSVSAMRKSLEEKHGQRGLTLNKVVSVISHLGHVTSESALMENLAGGLDRFVVDDLLEGLISSNMPGVSRVGREAVARFHARLCEVDMRSEEPSVRQHGIERLIEGLSRLRVMHVRGAFVNVVPNNLFEAQTTNAREKLLDVLVQPLSVEARVAMIERQLAKKQFSFAEACLDRLERQNGGHSPHINAFVKNGRTTLQQAMVLGSSRKVST
jgi:hypothetical protein